MDALNVIKQLCEKKGVTITQLENDLGYSNKKASEITHFSYYMLRKLCL